MTPARAQINPKRSENDLVQEQHFIAGSLTIFSHRDATAIRAQAWARRAAATAMIASDLFAGSGRRGQEMEPEQRPWQQQFRDQIVNHIRLHLHYSEIKRDVNDLGMKPDIEMKSKNAYHRCSKQS